MDAGKLNTRVNLIRQVKFSDGYGGFYSDQTTVKTFWADVNETDGAIDQKDGQRRHYTQAEFIIRKETFKDFKLDDLLEVVGDETKYRFNNQYESTQKYYIKVIATKIDVNEI